jgi:hypothetical protein
MLSRGGTGGRAPTLNQRKVDVNRSVDIVSLPTWTALWKHLARTRPPPPGGEALQRPVDDPGVREALRVGDCKRACTLVWPPYGPGVPAAYLVVAGPRGGLQLYDPTVENPGMGTCNAGPPGAEVKGLAPVVRATFTIEATSSTRVCLTDGGQFVPEGEGTDGLECMSACVGRDWKEEGSGQEGHSALTPPSSPRALSGGDLGRAPARARTTATATRARSRSRPSPGRWGAPGHAR